MQFDFEKGSLWAAFAWFGMLFGWMSYEFPMVGISIVFTVVTLIAAARLAIWWEEL